MELSLDLVRGRTWVLLAVDACDRAGLTPIEKERFHRLIFLSNCLAELFSATPPAKRVVRYKRGPFYPDVQWQLDRLVTMGLLSINGLSLELDKHGPWTRANYGIRSLGVRAAELIRQTPLGRQTGAYIDELVYGFAALNAQHLDDVALRELNYAAPGLAEGVLITFDDAETNRAIRKTTEIARVAPTLLSDRVRQKLQLYLRYIDASETAA